jgi:hypothetical protein
MLLLCQLADPNYLYKSCDMTAFAAINSVRPGTDIRIEILFYLVVDPVLGITPRDVTTRAQATFGTATVSATLLSVPHFPWPPAHRRGQIYLNTQVVAWYGVRQSVYRGETFLTNDSHYRRRITKCREERVAGGQSDVITFFADSALPNPLSKLEHELGHALGIRHTYSIKSPLYNGHGSSQGSRLTVSDVLDILWQINPSRQSQSQTLSSSAILTEHPRNSVTSASPIAQ